MFPFSPHFWLPTSIWNINSGWLFWHWNDLKGICMCSVVLVSVNGPFLINVSKYIFQELRNISGNYCLLEFVPSPRCWSNCVLWVSVHNKDIDRNPQENTSDGNLKWCFANSCCYGNYFDTTFLVLKRTSSHFRKGWVSINDLSISLPFLKNKFVNPYFQFFRTEI